MKLFRRISQTDLFEKKLFDIFLKFSRRKYFLQKIAGKFFAASKSHIFFYLGTLLFVVLSRFLC